MTSRPVSPFATGLVGDGAEFGGRGRHVTEVKLAEHQACYHNASMKNVLVRDIPDDVHAALQRRAEERGQSLQQYLAGELKRLAARPTLDQVLDRIEGRRGGRVGFEQAVDDLREERKGA